MVIRHFKKLSCKVILKERVYVTFQVTHIQGEIKTDFLSLETH